MLAASAELDRGLAGRGHKHGLSPELLLLFLLRHCLCPWPRLDLAAACSRFLPQEHGLGCVYPKSVQHCTGRDRVGHVWYGVLGSRHVVRASTTRGQPQDQIFPTNRSKTASRGLGVRAAGSDSDGQGSCDGAMACSFPCLRRACPCAPALEDLPGRLIHRLRAYPIRSPSWIPILLRRMARRATPGHRFSDSHAESRSLSHFPVQSRVGARAHQST